MPLKGRLCNTCLPHGSRVFGDLVPLRQDLIRSGRQGVGGRRRRARQLAAVSHLRAVRSRDSDLDARDVLRLRDPAEAPHAGARDPVRVRRLDRSAAPAALHDRLLPPGNPLHRLRHRDRLPVSPRCRPPPARLVRLRGVRVLPADPAGRVRLRLAQGCARMAVDRPKPQRLADHGLQSERLLWPGKGPSEFEQELGDIESQLGLTTLDKAIAWAQTRSMWPDTFGLACCAIEMMSIVSSRYDIARFGMEAFRSSPRQADLLIVSGRVAHKMAAPLRQIYDQMLEPKWVVAMGVCASSGGMFNNYTILQGVDRIVPVDIYVPFCPPRPEALMEGIIRLHEAHLAGVPPAYERRQVAI